MKAIFIKKNIFFQNHHRRLTNKEDFIYLHAQLVNTLNP